MKKHNFTGQLMDLIDKADVGTPYDIDYIMSKLSISSSIATTKFVDFALGCVKNTEGIERIKYYLFKGTLIQRNYASLFFNRIGEWKIVREAFDEGLIDEIQAFAR